MTVTAGGHSGEKIFGITQNGSSTSPNSVEVAFYSVPHGGDISTASTAYTWEAAQPTSIDLFYRYFQRLDQADVNSFGRMLSLGIESDADLRQDINDIQSILGATDGDTYLTGLTNTGANFVFFNLPDGTPSVTEVANTLNSQVGDRTYTGTYLTSGQTVAASLQALSSAITSSSNTRYIERLGSNITAGSAHTLPGSASYAIDGTGNGRGLWVFARGLLNHPGSVVTANDYDETSTTSVTFHAAQLTGDILDFFVI